MHVRPSSPKLLLICPKFPDNFWNFTKGLQTVGYSYLYTPTGLATIAALTPKEWKIRIVDENIEPIPFDEDADIVGITAMATQVPNLIKIAKKFKNRGKIVALGGPGSTVYMDEVVARLGISLHEICDVLFQGEAENTWPRFCQDYLDGKWQDRYQESQPVDLTTSPPSLIS